MKPRDFFHQLDHPRIVAAIRQAEHLTSGEVRVFVSRKVVADPVLAAQEQFIRLGMAATAQRNGVLIFVAPRSQKFAVVGDEGIHARCGQEFWHKLAEQMTPRFRDGHYTDGIVLGILEAGRLLREQFPRQADDRNELPDRVEHD